MTLHRGDLDQRCAGDRIGRFLRTFDRIEQVDRRRQYQRACSNRAECGGGIAAETRCSTDVVLLIGPALIEPIGRVEAVDDIVLGDLLDPAQYVQRIDEHLFQRPRRAASEHAHDPGPCAPSTFWVGGELVAIPRRVCGQRAARRLHHRACPRGGACHGCHGNQAAQEIRMTHAPLQCLHAAHGRADHSVDAVQAELAFQQPVLGGNHIANAETREAHTGLRSAVAGRSREPISDRIHAHDEVSVRIQCPARPDEEVEAMMVTT